MLYFTFVLVRFTAESHIDRVANIQLILQHMRDGAFFPVVGLTQRESHVLSTKTLIGIHSRTQYLLTFQEAGNLAGAVAGSAEGEDAAHHCGSLLVHNELALGILILFVAVGCPCPQALPALSLGPLYRPDLPAGVPHEPLVEQVFEGHQVVALGVFRVHIVVDGDVADAELREPLLDVQPCVQLVSPQTAEILGDDDPDFPVLHVRHHALEIRPVETGPGVSVIHIELDVGKAVVPGVLL